MTGFRKNIWKLLEDKIFRRAYVHDMVRSGIAFQIKAMREARKWSQTDLARAARKAQSNIARLEDPDYGKYTVQTLLEIADAYDVWLSVEFVPFSTGLKRTENRSPAALNAVSFSDDWESRSTGTATASTNKIFLVEVKKREPNPMRIEGGGLRSVDFAPLEGPSLFRLPYLQRGDETAAIAPASFQ